MELEISETKEEEEDIRQDDHKNDRGEGRNRVLAMMRDAKWRSVRCLGPRWTSVERLGSVEQYRG